MWAAAVIVVDAIAARDTGRLCSTVQITDTGICPGSGIGNLRMALNTETLGVPVIGVGVPTVTDASTLALDLLEKHHVSFDEKEIMKENSPMIVTSSDIDKQVREISRILSFGLNLALQPNLSMKDLEDLCY